MKRLITVLVLVAGGLSACTTTKYVQQEDAGMPEDDAAPQADAPQCGPDTYPCPPYGTVAGTIMEDLTFTGWIDDDGDGNPLNDPYRTWGLDYFYQQGKTDGAKFLMLNVSAGWCSVCRAETKTLTKLGSDYAAQGFRIAQVLFEDYDSNPATKDFVSSWEQYYQLPFPMGVDPTFKTGRYFDVAATPANLIIALRDMTLNGEQVKAMQLVDLETGYDEPSMRALFDNLAANSQ